MLRELKLESPFDLMGLYQGVSLEKKSVMDLPRGPDMVFLYRRPMLDYWAEGEETLGHLVTHVLVHEIGHHFGLSDADMAAHRGLGRRLRRHTARLQKCTAATAGCNRGDGRAKVLRQGTDLTRAFRT